MWTGTPSPSSTLWSPSSRTTYGQLWQGIAESADYMAIVFEEYDGVGAQVQSSSSSSSRREIQFLLDMSSRSNMVGARRALSSSPLVSMLRIREFPTVALFRRDHQQALYMNRWVDSILRRYKWIQIRK